MSNILVYALHHEGAFNKNSLGAVTEAARLAGELGVEAHAVVVGEGISDGLAARIDAGVTMEVTGVNVVDGQLAAERPILGDSSISTSRYKDKGIIIARLNAFEAKDAGSGAATVENIDAQLSP